MTAKKMGPVILFRITLGVSLFLAGLLVLFALVAVQVGGELKVVIQFFSTTKNTPTLREFNQLNILSPINTRSPMEQEERKLIDEMLMRYYLEMRYEQLPDVREMRYRWGSGGPVYVLSSWGIYNKFSAGLEKKLEDLPDIIVSIDIKQVKPGDNSFDVDFSVLEHLPNGQVRVKEKNVVAEFRYDLGRRTFSHFFSNPYGLVFVRFEETERKPVLN